MGKPLTGPEVRYTRNQINRRSYFLNEYSVLEVYGHGIRVKYMTDERLDFDKREVIFAELESEFRRVVAAMEETCETLN